MKFFDFTSKLTIFVNGYLFLVVTSLMLIYRKYDFYHNFLSKLGTYELGWLFNSAIVIVGIASFLFYIAVVKKYSYVNKYLKYSILVLGITASFSLLCIGFFVTEGEFSRIHDFFAVLYFMLLIPISLCLGLLMKTTASGSRFIILAILTIVATYSGLFIPIVNQFIFQKLITLLFGIFQIFIAIEMLNDENKQNETKESKE